MGRRDLYYYIENDLVKDGGSRGGAGILWLLWTYACYCRRLGRLMCVHNTQAHEFCKTTSVVLHVVCSLAILDFAQCESEIELWWALCC